jgi:hypothetical protein
MIQTPKETHMTRFALATILALALPLAAPAGTFDVTGQNGGTLDGTWTCLPVNGLLTCSSQSQVTTPGGDTGTRARTTVLGQGQLTSTLSGTRAGGRSFGRTTTVKR